MAALPKLRPGLDLYRSSDEAVYVGALFNLFVRLADAFDIHPPALYDSDGGVPAVVAGAAAD